MGNTPGHRELTEQEVEAINDIRAKAQEISDLISNLHELPGVDARWLSIGRTDMQTGVMALIRAVARPALF
ncbi:DUF7681 family protein [Sphingomonas sp. CJ99]